MPAKSQDKQPTSSEKPERREQETVIGHRILDGLGHPHDLHRVQVRRLWGDHYRVNVFVGVDAGSARVAHSYFLAADGEGNITACNPKLKKEY